MFAHFNYLLTVPARQLGKEMSPFYLCRSRISRGGLPTVARGIIAFVALKISVPFASKLEYCFTRADFSLPFLKPGRAGGINQ